MPDTGVVTLWTPTGSTYRFDPGTLCLEFAVTGADEWGIETLHTPADLARWAATSSLGVAGGLTARDVSVDDADLATARDLRRAIWALTRAVARSQRPPAAVVAAVNAGAQAAPPTPRLEARTATLRYERPVRCAAVLSAVARDAIDVVTGARVGRLHECAGEDCSLVFVDTSRPGTRRWCSMERCGNLNKVRRYRTGKGVEPAT